MVAPHMNNGAGHDGTNSSLIYANCASKFHNLCFLSSVNIGKTHLRVEEKVVPELSYRVGNDGTNSSSVCANCASSSHNSRCPPPSINVEETNFFRREGKRYMTIRREQP